MHQLARGVRHSVGHIRRLIAVIEEQQFSGCPIHLRVSRQATMLSTLELKVPLGFQSLRIKTVRVAGVVPQRHQSTRVIKEVRIGGILDTKFRAGEVKGSHDAIGCRAPDFLLIC